MDNMSLRQARELVQLSQAELAARAGLDRSVVHDLESGRNKRPSWQSVYLITEALKAAGIPGLQPQQVFPIEKAAA
jgi:transcriptional regulator with XRE-family HTH domain